MSPNISRYMKRTFDTLTRPFHGFGLRKFAFVRRAISWSKPASVVVHGKRFFIDRTDESVSRAMIDDTYEPVETELMRREVKPGMRVLDIGANIGYYTILFADLVGESGHVYAFEPAPVAYSLLNKNIAANGYKDRVTALHIGLSDQTGSARLYINEYNKGNNRLYDAGGMNSVDIQLARFDELPFAGDRFDLIKIDIEGAEALALRGMQSMLAAHKPTIMMEFYPSRYKRLNSTPLEILDLLEANDYSLWNIDGATGQIVPTTAAELNANYPDTASGGTNILCKATSH